MLELCVVKENVSLNAENEGSRKRKNTKNKGEPHKTKVRMSKVVFLG